MFLELSAWPTLNFDGNPGSSPFDIKKQEILESKSVNKEIKENKEDIKSINKKVRKYLSLLYVSLIVNSHTIKLLYRDKNIMEFLFFLFS